MSLINEALKKAQKLRAQEHASVQPPMPGGDTAAAPIIKRRKPLSARTVVWSLFGAVSLIVFSIAFTILFLSSDSTPPPAPAPTPRLVTRPAEPAPASPITPASETPPSIVATTPPAPAITVAPEPTPAATSPVATATTPDLPSAPANEPVARPSAPVIVQLDPEPAAPEPAPAPPTATASATPSSGTRPNPQVYQLIDTFRITGIRASATDPKVLMNDRLFRLNDIVDRATGLRIVKIESSSLTFVDAAGAVYTKNF